LEYNLARNRYLYYLVVIMDEQDVFRLQIRVDEMKVMQDYDWD